MNVGIKYDYTVGVQGTILASDITQIKNELENLRTTLSLTDPSTFANASHKILNGFVPTTSFTDKTFTITLDNLGFDLNDKIEVVAPADMPKDTMISINGVDYGLLPYDVTMNDTLNIIKITYNLVGLDLHVDLSDIGKRVQTLIDSLDSVVENIEIIEGEQYIGSLEQEKLDILIQLKSDYNEILNNFTNDVNKGVAEYLNFQEISDKDIDLTTERTNDSIITYQSTLLIYQSLKDRLTALSSKVDKINELITNKATFTTTPDNILDDLISTDVNNLHTDMGVNETDLNEMKNVLDLLDSIEQKILVDLTEVVPDAEVKAYPYSTTTLQTDLVDTIYVSPFSNTEGVESTFTFDNGKGFTTSLGFNAGDTLYLTYDIKTDDYSLSSVTPSRLGTEAKGILLALLELRAFRETLISYRGNTTSTFNSMNASSRASEVMTLVDRYKYVTRDLKTFDLEDKVIDKLLTEIETLDTNADGVETIFNQDVKDRFIESIDFIDVNARLVMDCIGKTIVNDTYSDDGYDGGSIVDLTNFAQSFDLVLKVSDLMLSNTVQTQSKYDNLVTYLGKYVNFGTNSLLVNKIDCVNKKIIDDRSAIILDTGNEVYNAWVAIQNQPNRNSLLKRSPIMTESLSRSELTSFPLPFISTEFYKMFNCQGLLTTRVSATGEFKYYSNMNNALNVGSGTTQLIKYMDIMLQPFFDDEISLWTLKVSGVENGNLFVPLVGAYSIPSLSADASTKFFSNNTRVFAINNAFWYYTKNDPVSGDIIWVEVNEQPQNSENVIVDFTVNVVGERVELYENEEMYYKGVSVAGVKMIHYDSYSVIENGKLVTKRYDDMLGIYDTSTFEPIENNDSYLGGLLGTNYTVPALTTLAGDTVVKAYDVYNY